MYDDVAKESGYNVDTLKDYKYVADKVKESLRNDNLEFAHHKAVAPLPPEKQEQFLKKAVEEKLTVRELRKEIQQDKFAELQRDIPLPQDKYDVIYADPPWKYDDKLIDGYGAAEHHYPPMSIEELCDLPIENISDKNAVLFMWVTSPFADECWDVIQAWGFEYKAMFVWDKVRHNYGHYNSVRHELLLICTKGSYLPQGKQLHDSVISIERSNEHSRKPEEFRQLIEQMYPQGRKIELFARGELPEGWKAWGNEVK
jgi:site-specific DNA-methyltransferase (adenine-specific)